MKSLTLPRALTAQFARRIVRIATIIVLTVVASATLLCYTLAYFFSPWWWLLIIPFVLLASVYVLVRLFVMFLIRRLSPGKLTSEQRDALDNFVDKIERLLEARSTPLPLIVLISIKDLLFYRDITTVKSVINDSVSLKRDYQELEKLFPPTR